ncbi:uncharacterized protein LOC134281466 [Saccostrea cucullata]|uniref:uncharacterized protein LOC134281466 n=1 Tax=Saccostrea cuccullata TaxID=36930 RepID=UPI002ED32BC3
MAVFWFVFESPFDTQPPEICTCRAFFPLAGDFREAEDRQKEREGKQLSFSLFSHSSYAKSEEEEGQDPEREEPEQDDVDIGVKHTRDMGVQCDPDPLLQENMALKAELRRLQGHKLSVDKIKDDNTKTKFYTGMPSFAVFMWLFNYLVPKCKEMVYWRGSAVTPGERTRPRRVMSLEPIDQFLATMMRLKIGLYVEDIAERFVMCLS